MTQLLQQRQAISQHQSLEEAEKAILLLKLGLFEEAEQLLAKGGEANKLLLAKAELAFLRHQYPTADNFVDELLARSPNDRAAKLLKAELLMQRWQLDQAKKLTTELLAEIPFDELAMCALSHIYRLEKDFTKALEWAEKAMQANPNNAKTFLAAAEIHFWMREMGQAETLLKQALEKDPFLADARYLYGYAIWRKNSMELLGQMAAQWELALSLNPWHHYTHWHWGNGHTHLTWKDYAEGEPLEANLALLPADSLFAAGAYESAYQLTDSVAAVYPVSPRPHLVKGSLLYLDPEREKPQALAMAAISFQKALAIKAHYGPAHNGLAAVIEQQKMAWLYCYDSLENALSKTIISRPDLLQEVFPDLKEYPERVAKMAESSLFTAKAYLPMLARLGHTFNIPPLHHDLARTTGNLYFRGALTFDKRQWMDIRGVGSGVAGIEYVERGVHLQRNVLLHEFVHLFHTQLLTDQQQRRIRELYLQAMRENRTLDYYSANNEHEFFAQTYTAYFMERKVHPLNHKSANTASELRQKDPDTWAFIDSLVQNERRFLNGDTRALTENWAQVYVNLAKVALRKSDEASLKAAHQYLDSAFSLSPAYLPALLQLGWWEAQASKSEAVFSKAASVYPTSASIYRARAEQYQKLFLEGKITYVQAFDWQYKSLQQAYDLENDVMERTKSAQQIIELCFDFAKFDLLLDQSERFLAEIPSVSSYLEDLRESIQANVWSLHLSLYDQSYLPKLTKLASENPYDRGLTEQLAKAHARVGEYRSAIDILEKGQKELKSVGYRTSDLEALLSFYRFKDGQSVEASTEWSSSAQARLLQVKILIGQGKTDLARELLGRYKFSRIPQEWADYLWVSGLLFEAENQPDKAISRYKEALLIHPWHAPAAESLLELLPEQGREKEAKRLLRTLKKQQPAFSTKWLLGWKGKL